jgi:hypothetical protein
MVDGGFADEPAGGHSGIGSIIAVASGKVGWVSPPRRSIWLSHCAISACAVGPLDADIYGPGAAPDRRARKADGQDAKK